MDTKREKDISKKLSYVLRHRPDTIDITLDQQGWTEIGPVLQKLNITLEELLYVVENNSKKRFALSANQQQIRANQGHSINIDLALEKRVPPAVLYHGSAMKNFELIKQHGLVKMNRHHVHLSRDIETAKEVGARHGQPVVFVVNSAAMAADNISFFLSDNGVWLTDFVDPQYLSELG